MPQIATNLPTLNKEDIRGGRRREEVPGVCDEECRVADEHASYGASALEVQG